MTSRTYTSPLPSAQNCEKAITLALSLAQAEQAIHAFRSGQVDAIVDTDGNAYLLRAAQENLRQNEQRLQAVLASIADVITVVNRGGIILSQSHAVKRVLGYGTNELVGNNIFTLIHEDDQPLLFSSFFNVIEGLLENDTVQFGHQDRDGSYRLIEATIGKFRDTTSESVVFSMRPFSR